MNLKEVITERRKEKKLSQEQLAEKIGVSRQTISKWELGETLPDIESLKKLAEELDFSIDEALDLDIDSENDRFGTIVLGAFIIGVGLSIAFNNYILSTVCGFIGFGIEYIVSEIKKKK